MAMYLAGAGSTSWCSPIDVIFFFSLVSNGVDDSAAVSVHNTQHQMHMPKAKSLNYMRD